MEEQPAASFATCSGLITEVLTKALEGYELSYHFAGTPGFLEPEDDSSDASPFDGYPAWQLHVAKANEDPAVITTFLDGCVEVAEFALQCNADASYPARSVKHRFTIDPWAEEIAQDIDVTQRGRTAAVARAAVACAAARLRRIKDCYLCGHPTAPEDMEGVICDDCVADYQACVAEQLLEPHRSGEAPAR